MPSEQGQRQKAERAASFLKAARSAFCYIDQFPLLGRKHRNIACGDGILWYNYFVKL